jgi:tight adherence protein B
VNPDYIRLLWTDPVGIKLLWLALWMLVAGLAWLRQAIRIRI